MRALEPSFTVMTGRRLRLVQHLLALLRGLRGDPVANLRAAVEHASVIADLGHPTNTADGCSGGEGTEIVVVDVRREAGGS